MIKYNEVVHTREPREGGEEFMDYSYSYYYSTGDELGAGYYIGIGIAAIIMIIAWWRIFSKAGERGWKILIPVYNIYTMYKLFWRVAAFVILICIGVVTVIGSVMMSYGFASALLGGNSSGAFMGGIVLLIISGIAALVIQVMFYSKLSRSFGHGAGFTVGLFFLPVIFLLIIAFGSSKYTGGGSERLSDGPEDLGYRYREPDR